MNYYNRDMSILPVLNAVLCDVKSEKKFRRLLSDFKDEISLLSDGVRRQFSDDTPTEDIRALLRAQNEKYMEMCRCRDRDLYYYSMQLSAGEEFCEFLRNTYYLHFRRSENNIYIESEVTAVISGFALTCAECDMLENSGKLFVEWYELDMGSDGWILRIADDNDRQLNISFSDAEKFCIPCNALGEAVYYTGSFSDPWEYLSYICEAVCDHIDHNAANEKELRLKETAMFLHPLEKAGDIPSDFAKAAERAGALDIVLKYKNEKHKMFMMLSDSKYERLWRELYGAFCDSQKDIPTLAEIKYDGKTIKEHREFVTSEFRKHGFEGEYPCFHRFGEKNDISIASSYGSTYIVGKEKQVKSFVRCGECVYGDSIGVDMICGTLLRDSDNEADIFSCMFDRGRKAYFSRIATAQRLCADRMERFTDGFQRVAISAATKSALMKNLTKEERRYKQATYGKAELLIMVVVFAAIFAFVMSAGFALIEFAATMIFTHSIGTFAECFMSTPWWKIALGCGIPFGVAMVICEVLSNNK